MSCGNDAETDAGEKLIAVDRAIGDFRRGLPVVITAAQGAIVAAAAELISDTMLARLRGLTASTLLLATTQSRARALNVLPSGYDIVLLPMRKWLDAVLARGIGDATTDLAQPLRGPLTRLKRAPSVAEGAAVGLAKAARLLPAAVLGELSVDDAQGWSAANNLLTVTASAIRDYDATAAQRLTRVVATHVPLTDAQASQIIAFRPADGGIEHLAIVVGEPARDKPVLTRLHSECFTGDLLASLKCDCGEQLRGAIAVMEAEGAGILLYLAQEGRGIGLINKLRAYRLQEDGFDTVDANLRLGFDADERIFQPAAEMLRQLGVKRVRLLTNNPDKVAGLSACGIEVSDRVAHSFPANSHNELYLDTKKTRSGHLL